MTAHNESKARRKLHRALADELQVDRAARLTALGVPCAVRKGWVALLDPDGLAARLASGSGWVDAATAYSRGMEDASAVIPGQNSGKPSAEAVADALIQYETSGLCHGRTCGLCDCGRSDETPEQTRTRNAMDLDRARAVLATFPPQRCAPGEDELADALHADACPEDPDDGEACMCSDYRREARIILDLFAAQPTVAQVKAEAVSDLIRRIRNELDHAHFNDHFLDPRSGNVDPSKRVPAVQSSYIEAAIEGFQRAAGLVEGGVE